MIHSTAQISNNCFLGKNVSVGPYSIIHDDVIIHDNVVIEGYCEIGVKNKFCDKNRKLYIGKDSLIRSHSIIYNSSVIGENFVTGHRVTIRENSHIGCNVQVGTLSDIQGSCRIGDFVKMHSNVHIGQHSIIRDFVWLFPYVVLTNDPHPPSELLIGCDIGEYSVIATNSVILPGVKIGKDVLVGASSLVNINLESEYIYSGNPVRKIAHVSKIKLKNNRKLSAYPWRRHFHKGYPVEIVNKWKNEFGLE